MSYTTYDFSETMAGQGISRDQIEKVEAAWGEWDCAEWTGGFVIKLKDGRRLYVSGWCDTTGWGCQDGTNCRELAADEPLPDGSELERWETKPHDWDVDPADLNRYVATGEGKWD